MDSMEDFEFRPLTEGLGFHKKDSKEKSSLDLSPSHTGILPSLNDELKLDLPIHQGHSHKIIEQGPRDSFGLDKSFLESEEENPSPLQKKETPLPSSLFSTPLPREGEKRKSSSAKVEVTPVSIPRFGQVAKSTDLDQVGSSEKIKSKTRSKILHQESEENLPQLPEPKFEAVPHNLLSLLLDFTVVMGLSFLFTLSLVLATGIDIVPIFQNIKSDIGSQLGIALLVFSACELYMILSRCFFGRTLGEWSIDTQLGSVEDQAKLSYIGRLVLRTVILVATGFVTLPLISILTGKDLLAPLSGLKLYRMI